MRNGKYTRSTGFKPLALLLAMALLVGCAIGGTLAWLTDKTQEVKNTFTTSGIDIELTETDTTKGSDGNESKNFKMVPGWKIDKDPKVTVKAGSEDCYLFVKVEKSTNLDNYIAYNLETDRKDESEKSVWTKLDGTDNVYYIVVTKTTVDKEIPLLLAGSYTDPMGTTEKTEDDVTVSWKVNQVAVKPSVTKEMMEAITTGNEPKLTFTAYASQLYKNNTETFAPAEAWANVPKDN